MAARCSDRVACGQSICGTDLNVWTCSTASWAWTGQRCVSEADAGSTDGVPFQCAGYNPGGPFPLCEKQTGVCAGASKPAALCQGGVWLACTDADYTAFSASYGVETCDGLDSNCNGQADEEGAAGCTTYFLDADQDGYGAAASSSCLCAATGGLHRNGLR